MDTTLKTPRHRKVVTGDTIVVVLFGTATQLKVQWAGAEAATVRRIADDPFQDHPSFVLGYSDLYSGLVGVK